MVVDEPEAALRLLGDGRDVVFVVPDGSPPLRPPGPGRLAVMVGDPEDGRVAAAAAEMDEELFAGPATSPPGPAPA